MRPQPCFLVEIAIPPVCRYETARAEQAPTSYAERWQSG